LYLISDTMLDTAHTTAAPCASNAPTIVTSVQLISTTYPVKLSAAVIAELIAVKSLLPQSLYVSF